MLPPVCIICRGKKYVSNKFKGTRVIEPLRTCELINGGLLAVQARAQNDEAILKHIEGKDCVAIEVRYHLSCYREYTRPLSRKIQPDDDCSVEKWFMKSFDKLCKEVIEPKIIRDKAVYRLTKLRKLFVKIIRNTQNVNAEPYKTHNLKQRLLMRYPQLKFLRPKKRNQSEMVYVDELSTEFMLNDERCGSIEPSDDSAGTTDSEDNEGVSVGMENLGEVQSSIRETLAELYNCALDLRDDINGVPAQTMPWPHTSSDLTLDMAAKLVPARLFNFIAWMCELSSDPEDKTFVQVSDDEQRKILSISQDIIYLASKGRKAMPKHSSLSMAVRHLTGSAQLIGILNGFGHSTSHTVVLEHDTALAKKELQQGDDSLPACLQKQIFTTLVWDNNDFGEETLSGRGTTHNTSGIAIQHQPSLSEGPQTTEIPTNVRKNRQRSLPAPDTKLNPFFGKKKANPQTFGMHISLGKDQYKGPLEEANWKDYGYFLTKYKVSYHILFYLAGLDITRFLLVRFPQRQR